MHRSVQTLPGKHHKILRRLSTMSLSISTFHRLIKNLSCVMVMATSLSSGSGRQVILLSIEGDSGCSFRKIQRFPQIHSKASGMPGVAIAIANTDQTNC